MKKTRLIPYLFIAALLFLSCVTPVVQVQAEHSEPSSLFDIEPFIDGSNQEWAIEMLSMFDNSEEKIRFYDFLLHAYTFLMRYDGHNYTHEYYNVRDQWLSFLEEIPSNDIEQMLEDEAWTIDIFYPIERPFDLSLDEFIHVYFTFIDANPQFMSHPMFAEIMVPVSIPCDVGRTPGINVLAYWAFAERRQEAYQHFINTFEPIPWEPGRYLGVWSDYPVIIHVPPDQEEEEMEVAEESEEAEELEEIEEIEELEETEELEEEWEDDNDSYEESGNDQDQAASRQNLILFSILGAILLLAITIFVIIRRKAGKEPEIHVEPFEHEEQGEKSSSESMITINCEFCGARINVAKGKSQKCPYCDCIIKH